MDHPKFGVFYTLSVSLLVVAGAGLAMPLINGFWMFSGVAAVWGYFSSAFIVGQAIIMVELFVMKNLTTMFGIGHLFRAVGNGLGSVFVQKCDGGYVCVSCSIMYSISIV